MTNFKVVKRFPLAFLGKGWEETYIDFYSLNLQDIKKYFPSIAGLDEKKQEDVIGGLDKVLELLELKFVSGKGKNEKNELVDLVKEDLQNLPIEIIGRAISFLSQSATPPSLKP